MALRYAHRSSSRSIASVDGLNECMSTTRWPTRKRVWIVWPPPRAGVGAPACATRVTDWADQFGLILPRIEPFVGAGAQPIPSAAHGHPLRARPHALVGGPRSPESRSDASAQWVSHLSIHRRRN